MTLGDLVQQPAFWGFIGVVIGGLITGIVSILLEVVRARSASKLDATKRQDDRWIEWTRFQWVKLQEVQQAADTLTTTTSAIVFGPVPPSHDLVETNRQALYLVSRLASNIADEEARRQANALVTAADAVAAAPIAAAASLLDMATARKALIDRSGLLIRTAFSEANRG